MKSFTDNLGRAWTLVVNVATIKRVRTLCNVDLNSIIEVEEDGIILLRREKEYSLTSPSIICDRLTDNERGTPSIRIARDFGSFTP